ncbi:hypothetical protein K474DRAFT_1211231 [Panus rudis PR-1116 ss-1]|nr:hypothetical protein K474DRAFT_1211231 [Panus rudis PR-1116 ss-1]
MPHVHQDSPLPANSSQLLWFDHHLSDDDRNHTVTIRNNPSWQGSSQKQLSIDYFTIYTAAGKLIQGGTIASSPSTTRVSVIVGSTLGSIAFLTLFGLFLFWNHKRMKTHFEKYELFRPRPYALTAKLRESFSLHSMPSRPSWNPRRATRSTISNRARNDRNESTADVSVTDVIFNSFPSPPDTLPSKYSKRITESSFGHRSLVGKGRSREERYSRATGEGYFEVPLASPPAHVDRFDIPTPSLGLDFDLDTICTIAGSTLDNPELDAEYLHPRSPPPALPSQRTDHEREREQERERVKLGMPRRGPPPAIRVPSRMLDRRPSGPRDPHQRPLTATTASSRTLTSSRTWSQNTVQFLDFS